MKSSRVSSFRVLSILVALLIAPLQNSYADTLEGMPSGEYNLDLTHASIVWKVDHFGLSDYVGRFNKFDATVELNSEEFSQSSVAVVIDTASLDTDYPNPEKEDFNKKLIDTWLDGVEFPKITFTSTSVSELQGDKFTVSGELTMLGKTLPVVLDGTLNGAIVSHPFTKKPTIGFGATTTIKRGDWGVDKFIPNVGADVRVEIQGEFRHKS